MEETAERWRRRWRSAQGNLESFRAIAASTACNCFVSSSRRVDLFGLEADDEADLLE